MSIRIAILAFLLSQTLADKARLERQKKGPPAKVVVTEGKTVTTSAGTSKTADAPVPAPAAASAKGPVDNKGRDEKWWRTTFSQARQELKRFEDKAKLLDLRVTDLSAQLLREGMANREQELRLQLDKAKAEQTATKTEQAKAEQKIRDLEDELRRSGGLPGWAR